MKKAKLLCLMISTVMVASALLTGCKSSSAPAAGDTKKSSLDAKIDTSKEVKITGYLLGAAPAGFNDVMKELNNKLKKDINATMDINYIGWGDLQSKYPLVLASGENLDWIYTADWAFYQQMSVKNAFKEISNEDLQKYMPLHYGKLDKQAYKEVAIKGKNYMIPSSTPDKKVQTVAIRGDLRKKYNVPEIKTINDLGPYFEAIKKNEPNMIPANLDSQYDVGALFYDSQYAYGYSIQEVAEGVTLDQFDKTGKLYDKLGPNNGEIFRKSAKLMKEWYDKGYINKNPFANKVRSKDALVQGKSAIGLGNSIDIQSILTQGQQANMDIEVIPVLNKEGKSAANSYLNNAVAISANSKNPERTMMALDLIMEDKAYDYLVYFGIEGKNYTLTADNKIGLPQGVTAENNTYPPDAAGFWFTNKDIFPPLATWTDKYVALKKQIPSYLTTSPMTTFSFDPTNVKTEIASLTQVDQQYFNPIEVGSVADVDQAIKTLLEKQKAAGWQKVYDEAKKQVDAYVANNK